MLIPLGLAIPLPRIPWACIFITVLLLACYFFIPQKDYSSNVIDLANQHDIPELMYNAGQTNCAREIQPLGKYFCQLALSARINQLFATHLKPTPTNLEPVNFDKFSALFVGLTSAFKAPSSEIYLKNLMSGKIAADNDEAKLFLEQYNKWVLSCANYYQQYNLLSPLTLTVSSIFFSTLTHHNILHLVSNIVGLLIFGIFVEMLIGIIPTIILFFFAGIIGNIFYVWLHLDSYQYLLGASAGVYGLIGAFGVLFYREKFVFWLTIIFSNMRITLPVVVVVFLYYALQELLGVSLEDGIAHGAHLYGMLVGVLAGVSARLFLPSYYPFIFVDDFQLYQQLSSNKVTSWSDRSQLWLHLLRLRPDSLFIHKNFAQEIFERNLQGIVTQDQFELNLKSIHRYFYLLEINKQNDQFLVDISKASSQFSFEQLTLLNSSFWLRSNLNYLQKTHNLELLKLLLLAYLKKEKNIKLRQHYQHELDRLITHLELREST